MPHPEALRYSSDVRDPAALRARLSDTDLFGANPAEGVGYVNHSLERFRITMTMVPQLAPGASVLELGSNPYFITRLLRERGLEVLCANWFGEGALDGDTGTQTVTESGVAHTYEFDHFNIERDRFPYPDDSFDLVMFCEILEHLPNDPTHTLSEIHRVLRPDGLMLLTTPNATRLENLAFMVRGDNVYESLSGYGTYGRHNREYTVAELDSLLRALGYDVVELTARDIVEPPPELEWGSAVEPANRGGNLFALARATGVQRWRYPEWLYQSRHALARVVRADLVMGVNDDLQCRGFHELEEHTQPPFRWTGASEAAVVVVSTPLDGPQHLRLEGAAAPPGAGQPLSLTASIGERSHTFAIACDGQPFALDAPIDAPAGRNEVTLTTDRVWSPNQIGGGLDERRLGVAIRQVSLQPAPGAA